MKIDDLTDAITSMLTEYYEDVQEIVNDSAELAAKESVKVVRKIGDFNDQSGKYRKSWKVSKERNIIGDVKCTVHARAPYYRLTHLLEHGHALPQGGRSKAYPHIKPAEELAQNLFEKKVRDGIEKL